MYSSLNVSLNGKSVTLHDTNYHYEAYLQKLLTYVSDASGTHLVSRFWYLDLSGELKKLKYLSNSQTIELYGRLNPDLINSDKMLFDGVDMNIKLTRASEAFFLLAHSDDKKLRVKILDATLINTEVEFNHPLLLTRPNILAMKRKTHYPVTILTIKYLLRVLGPSKSLLIMPSFEQFPKIYA